MGLATAKLILSDKPDKGNGLHDVRIRFIKDRVVRYINLGVTCQRKHWNDKADEVQKKWLYTGHTNHQADNAFLTLELERARALIREHPSASADELKGLFSKPREAPAPPPPPVGAPDFLTYFRAEVLRCEKYGNPRTAAKRRTVLGKLEKWAGEGNPLPFSLLTPAWIRDWKAAYLAKYPKGAQSVNKELEVIRTVFKQAVLEQVVPFESNPFLYVKLSRKGGGKRKARLTTEQIAAFEALPIPEKPIRSKKHWAQLARDAWLLAFHLQGTRIGDVIELRLSHVQHDRLVFQERKTGKTKSVIRHPRLDAILDRYIAAGTRDPDRFLLGLLDHRAAYAQSPSTNPEEARLQKQALLKKIESLEATINEWLKRLAKLAGLDLHLTTHVARHTFANQARVKLRGNVAAIKDLLGHADLATTQQYLAELEEGELDTEALQVYYGAAGKTWVKHDANTDEQTGKKDLSEAA